MGVSKPTQRLSQRRARVVPIVTRKRRRLWRSRAESDAAALLHALYFHSRDKYLPKYFASFNTYSYPESWVAKAWRWYAGDVLLQSVKLLRRNGRAVQAEEGVAMWQQLLSMVRLSISLPTPPENYYKFELYRSKNRTRAGEYLHNHETKGVLFELLYIDVADAPSLTDKLRFIQHAEICRLSVTPAIALVRGPNNIKTFSEPPRADIFVKPQADKSKNRAQAWTYDQGTDSYRQVAKPTVTSRADILRTLAKRSRGPLIVQPRLENHPDLKAIALDATPTCRVVTITNEAGEGEPVIAVFRMPTVVGKVVDDIASGGISAPIHLESGILGPATDLGRAPLGRHQIHPLTGAPIEGRTLPYWHDVLGLAVQAHHCFAPRLMTSWDLAITPNGPVLIEGNSQLGVDALQRAHNSPLGSHRFGELLAFHLAHKADLSALARSHS